MKKLLVLSCMLLSANCFSQGLARNIMSRLEFGLKAGANYSNFSNAQFTTDPLTGFHAGATMAFKITDHFSVQEDILFSLQGAKAKDNLFGGKDIRLCYVSIPLLLRYKTRLGLYMEAGPQVSMKVSEDIHGLETSGDFAQKLDMGIAGGIGYQTRMGLGIGARYIYGLSKVGNMTLPGINKDFRNNMVQASIFYVF